jgi:hypothetical protein
MARQRAPKSRAGKRTATPPPPDLSNIPRPSSPPAQEKVAVLGLRGNAGVKKRTKKKQLSAKQKQRKEKTMEKGEAAAEKLTRKKDESKQKGLKMQTRRVSCLNARGKYKATFFLPDLVADRKIYLDKLGRIERKIRRGIGGFSCHCFCCEAYYQSLITILYSKRSLDGGKERSR